MKVVAFDRHDTVQVVGLVLLFVAGIIVFAHSAYRGFVRREVRTISGTYRGVQAGLAMVPLLLSAGVVVWFVVYAFLYGSP